MYSVDQRQSFPITDGLAEVSEPVFDRSGKYLYLSDPPTPARCSTGSRSPPPTTAARATSTSSCLRNDLPSPLAQGERRREAGREQPTAERDAEGETGPSGPDAAKPAEPVRIDFDGIEYRILDLPVPAGDLSNLQAGDAGQLFYLRASWIGAADAGIRAAAGSAAAPFRPGKREDESCSTTARDYRVSADGKKLLYATRDAWSIVPLSHARSTRRRAGSTSTTSRSGSIRGPSGRRSSTRPGASTATTSTPPTCTASTGRR